MLTVLVSVAAIAVVVRICASGGRRLPETARAEIAKTIRDLRLRSGAYSLAHLMRHMVDDMLASVLPSISKSYLPNEMRFGLHPRDAQRWGAFFPELERELRSLMLAQVTERRDLHLQGELMITVVEDEQARPGFPALHASMTRAAPARRPAEVAHDGRTEALSDQAATKLAPGVRGAWSISVEGQPPVSLHGEMTVGRDRRSDIRIDRDEVSRAHARLVVANERVTIDDLVSSNGTSVNAQPVDSAVLEPGDVISFGGHTATLHRSTEPRESRV